MKKSSKLKLTLGIILAIILVGILSTYLNYTLSRKNSFEATISADTFQVGTTLGGTITNIAVEEGDIVSEGQTLARLQSAGITEAISDGSIVDNSSFKITGNQTISLLASQPGTVSEVLFDEGSFVSSNDVIMKLDELSDPYVEALFRLLPPDYDRVTTNTKLIITLPNNDTFEATVSDIVIQRTQDEDQDGIDTLITAMPINAFSDQRKFPVGTPVKATMLLQDDDSFFSTLRKNFLKIFNLDN